MKVLVVRVNKAEVIVASEVVSFIKEGLAVFIGIENGDNQLTLVQMAERIVNLRIFEDQDGRMNYSVKDKFFSLLCIPNFTLCANTDSGRRPSFDDSMAYAQANKLFDIFLSLLGAQGLGVEAGIFGAYMEIKLDLAGPVNIVLNSEK